MIRTQTTPGERTRLRVPRIIGIALASLVLLFSAFLVVIRLFNLDANTELALPVAGMPYAAAATILVLLGLLIARKRLPVLLALVLAVIELVWLVPRFLPGDGAAQANAATLRVAVSNTFHGRADPAALVNLVRTQRVDVLALAEVTDRAVQRYRDAGLGRVLRYSMHGSSTDTALFSRFPLSRNDLPVRSGRHETAARLDVRGHRVRLIAVHVYYPVGDAQRWAGDLAALRADAAGGDGNLVMLGDFNASLDHTPMRALLGAGLTDTHAELGHGWAPTWPVGWLGGVLPPLVQLDHVLHGPGIVGRTAAQYTIPGTDHRAVVTELAIGR